MFESVLDAVNGNVDTFVIGAWNTLTIEGAGIIRSVFVLYIAIWGYLLWMGRTQLTWADGLTRVFTVAFVYVFVTHVPLLIETVFVLATDVPEALATTLLQATGGLPSETTINQTLDDINNNAWETFRLMREDAGLTNPTPFFLGLALVILTLLVVGFTLFLVVLAKLATAVLLAVGPIFILLYLFAGTRGLFEGWLRQTLSFALIPIFVYGLLALIISLMDAVSQPLLEAAENQALDYTQMAAYSLVMVVSFLLATQVIGWAAGIAGAFQLSTMGAFGQNLTRLAGGARSGAYAGGRAAVNLGRRLRGNRSPAATADDASQTGQALSSTRAGVPAGNSPQVQQVMGRTRRG